MLSELHSVFWLQISQFCLKLKIDEKIEKKREGKKRWMKEKKEKYLEEERRTEPQLFRKNFEKIVLLNNEQFYWTKYFTEQAILMKARRSV